MVCYRNMIYPSPNQHRPWMTLNIAQFWAETNLPTLYLEPFHPIPRFADAWLRIESHLHVSSDAQGQDCSEIVRTSLWQSQSWNYTQCLFSVTICISIISPSGWSQNSKKSAPSMAPMGRKDILKWPSQQPLGAMSRDDLLEQLRGIGMPCVLGGASAERCDWLFKIV